MGCLAAIAHSRLWPITTCCAAVADGRFRGKADSGITPEPRLFSASGCLGPTQVVTRFINYRGTATSTARSECFEHPATISALHR